MNDHSLLILADRPECRTSASEITSIAKRIPHGRRQLDPCLTAFLRPPLTSLVSQHSTHSHSFASFVSFCSILLLLLRQPNHRHGTLAPLLVSRRLSAAGLPCQRRTGAAARVHGSTGILDAVRKHGFVIKVTMIYEYNWQTNLAEFFRCVGYLCAHSKPRR